MVSIFGLFVTFEGQDQSMKPSQNRGEQYGFQSLLFK